jgi:hypothetical protein
MSPERRTPPIVWIIWRIEGLTGNLGLIWRVLEVALIDLFGSFEIARFGRCDEISISQQGWGNSGVWPSELWIPEHLEHLKVAISR